MPSEATAAAALLAEAGHVDGRARRNNSGGDRQAAGIREGEVAAVAAEAPAN